MKSKAQAEIVPTEGSQKGEAFEVTIVRLSADQLRDVLRDLLYARTQVPVGDSRRAGIDDAIQKSKARLGSIT